MRSIILSFSKFLIEMYRQSTPLTYWQLAQFSTTRTTWSEQVFTGTTSGLSVSINHHDWSVYIMHFYSDHLSMKTQFQLLLLPLLPVPRPPGDCHPPLICWVTLKPSLVPHWCTVLKGCLSLPYCCMYKSVVFPNSVDLFRYLKPKKVLWYINCHCRSLLGNWKWACCEQCTRELKTPHNPSVFLY